jgi:hypothetical protein
VPAPLKEGSNITMQKRHLRKLLELVPSVLGVLGVLGVLAFLVSIPAAFYGTHHYLGCHWAFTTLIVLNSLIAYFSVMHVGTLVNLQSELGGLFVTIYYIAMPILYLVIAWYGAHKLWSIYVA